MAFVHGSKTKVLVDEFDMSGYLSNTDQSWDVDTPESTVYGDGDRKYISGLRTMTLSMSGFWDQASSEYTPEPVLPTRLGQEGVVLLSYAPYGLTAGRPVYSMQCRETNYTVNSPVDGIVGINLDVQGTDILSNGVSLHNLTAVTSTAANDDPYEYQLPTSGLGAPGATTKVYGYLHVTNISSAGVLLDVKLQHSSDSTSWTDLKSFTQASDETAERISTSATIKLYARCFWTMSGSQGSATFSTVWHNRTS